jgi:hypothetical protein
MSSLKKKNSGNEKVTEIKIPSFDAMLQNDESTPAPDGGETVTTGLSYLEKSKMKEEMRKLIEFRMTSLKMFIEDDYAQFRECLRIHKSEKNINIDNYNDILESDVGFKRDIQVLEHLSKLLIDIKASDSAFPNLDLLKRTCSVYLQFLNARKPNLLFEPERVIKLFQEKISICLSVMHICDVYECNSIWREHMRGRRVTTKSVFDIP